MSLLDEDRWRKVSPYLDQALELDVEARAAWLASVRAADPSVADDLEALLLEREAIRSEGFLEHDLPTLLGPVPLAGQIVGAYTLVSLIGRGGMGSVWLAQRSDGRFVGHAAIKLLHAAGIGHAGGERFQREGSVLARLRHPNIAHLIDAGVSSGGQPYLVLEHVDGQHIDHYCDERRLGIEARIRLFLDVLGAVAHAHANLIVHRDLKPSNVLVATNGQVKLLDFGIAKLLEPTAGGVQMATGTSERALTPQYAAPEQLKGEDITTATDVYALGVLFYVLLTGRHPAGTDRDSAAGLIRAVVETEPQRPSDAVADEPAPGETSAEIAARRAVDPRKLRSTLRGDLDNIIAKALKKRPLERYASAEAMADDLRRYLDHLPVRARADSFGYRSRKFVARHRLAFGAATTTILALAAGTTLAVWQARAAARQRDRAVVELDRAEATNDLTSFLLAEATPKAGRPITNAELLARGAQLIDRRFGNDPELRVHMLLTLADRYQENQQFDRQRETLERAFALSRGIRDPGLRSRAACARADILSEKGDPSAAEALLAETFVELAGWPDAARDEARCRVYESIVAFRKGDLVHAVSAAQRAVTLAGQQRPAMGAELEIEAWSALANAQGQGPGFASADEAYRKVVALLDAQGRGESRDAAVTLSNWSAMLQNAGQHAKAVPLSERVVRMAREQDAENGASQSQLTTYGSALAIVGRSAQAATVMDEAVAKARAAGSAPRLFTTLGTAATAYREAGDLDKAARTLSDAQALLQANPSFPAHFPGLLDRHLARLALARGDASQAVDLALRGRERYEAAKRPPSEMLPILLVVAEAQNAHGEHDAALATAARALSMARERLGGFEHSYNVGQAHLEIGVAHAGRKNPSAAREELRQAVNHLRASVGPEAPTTRRARAELARLGP